MSLGMGILFGSLSAAGAYQVSQDPGKFHMLMGEYLSYYHCHSEEKSSPCKPVGKQFMLRSPVIIIFLEALCHFIYIYLQI